MPFPALAVAGLATSLYSTYAQGRMNAKTRDFSREMYDRQRQDSLSDWEMQNAYNSPAEVMKRYKDAGLNPNLIYGNGTNAEAGTPRQSSVESWNPQAATVSLNDMYTGMQADAELNIKNAQAKNIEADTKAKNLGMLATMLGMDVSRLGMDKTRLEMKGMSQLQDKTAMEMGGMAFEQSLRKMYGQDMLELAMKKTMAEIAGTEANTKFTLDENQRKEVMQAKTLEEATARIASIYQGMGKTKAEMAQIYQNIELLKKEGILKEFEISLNKAGVTKGDNIVYRQLIDKLAGLIGEGNNLSEKIDDMKKKAKAYSTVPGASPFWNWFK